jgi:hypothetical protein
VVFLLIDAVYYQYYVHILSMVDVRIRRMRMDYWWNDRDRGRPKCSAKTLSTTNPTWSALRSNAVLCGEKSAAHRLMRCPLRCTWSHTR